MGGNLQCSDVSVGVHIFKGGQRLYKMYNWYLLEMVMKKQIITHVPVNGHPQNSYAGSIIVRIKTGLVLICSKFT